MTSNRCIRREPEDLVGVMVHGTSLYTTKESSKDVTRRSVPREREHRAEVSKWGTWRYNKRSRPETADDSEES